MELPPLNDPSTMVALAAVALAGVVRGFSGFGAALIMVPPLSVIYGPAAAVPMMALIDSIGTLPLAPNALRRCAWREVGPITFAAFLFVPVGVQVLVWADPDIMAQAIALGVLAAAAVLATGWRYAGQASLPLTLGTGAAAGFLATATGIGGPPVVLFWLAGRSDAPVVRANIIVFFFLLSIGTFLTYLLEGLLTGDVWLRVAAFVPVYALAIGIGARLFGRASEVSFRRIALCIVMVVALLSLIG